MHRKNWLRGAKREGRGAWVGLTGIWGGRLHTLQRQFTNRPAVGVGAGVGHGQHTGASVLEDEVLVSELGAVDGLAAGAVACRKKRGERGRVRGEFHA